MEIFEEKKCAEMTPWFSFSCQTMSRLYLILSMNQSLVGIYHKILGYKLFLQYLDLEEGNLIVVNNPLPG